MPWPFIPIALAALAASLIGGELPRERIVYTTVRPANWELYLFERESSPKQITNDPALDYDPTFRRTGGGPCFVRSVPGTRICLTTSIRYQMATRSRTANCLSRRSMEFGADSTHSQ
jgi:hypothetical protein